MKAELTAILNPERSKCAPVLSVRESLVTFHWCSVYILSYLFIKQFIIQQSIKYNLDSDGFWLGGSCFDLKKETYSILFDIFIAQIVGEAAFSIMRVNGISLSCLRLNLSQCPQICRCMPRICRSHVICIGYGSWCVVLVFCFVFVFVFSMKLAMDLMFQ